jgi:hypothetical protein
MTAADTRRERPREALISSLLCPGSASSKLDGLMALMNKRKLYTTHSSA